MMYLDRPMIVDSFAGGGGASTGIEAALGRSPDIAINHNPVALAMHAANHPETLHLSENVWKVDPLDYLAGKHIGLAWFSPDCKHFSKAKGGKPVERNIRDLAWIIPGWIERIQRSGGKVDVVILENVEEFKDWSPLIDTDKGLMPDPSRRGETFFKWCRKLRSLGGKIQHRELRGCDYGAPTIRKRLFIIVRFDGKKIVWPKATHGAPDDPDVQRGLKKPHPWVADCIDWSLPCPSIFDTRAEIKEKWNLDAIRPLADATMSRIARGVYRYVLQMVEDGKQPFLVNLTHHDKGDRCEPVNAPAMTITGANRGEKAVVVPLMSYAQQGGGNRAADAPAHTITASAKDQNSVIAPSFIRADHHSAAARNGVQGPQEPIRTITGNGGMAIAAPYLVPRYGERPGQEPRTMPADAPAGTIVPTSNQGSLAAVYLAQNNTGMTGHSAGKPMSTMVQKGCTQSVIAASLMNMKGADRADSSMEEPAPTQTAGGSHASVVAPVMVKYYGVEGESGHAEPLHTATSKARFTHVEAELDVPPLSEAQLTRAREVAAFLRSYGFWDEREIVTLTIAGTEFVMTDIGMRMLIPRELFNAQGFPSDYIIDLKHEGRALSKSEQIACCGNSVCPPLAEALVAANCDHLIDIEEAAVAA